MDPQKNNNPSLSSNLEKGDKGTNVLPCVPTVLVGAFSELSMPHFTLPSLGAWVVLTIDPAATLEELDDPTLSYLARNLSINRTLHL